MERKRDVSRFEKDKLGVRSEGSDWYDGGKEVRWGRGGRRGGSESDGRQAYPYRSVGT